MGAAVGDARVKKSGQDGYATTWAGRGLAGPRSKLMESRRRLATVVAIAIAVLLGYHVVAGNNGLTVYKQKIADDKALAVEVKQLQKENDRLKRHVEHLATDPGAIEYEAHVRLRYMRPGQVTVLNDANQSKLHGSSATK